MHAMTTAICLKPIVIPIVCCDCRCFTILIPKHTNLLIKHFYNFRKTKRMTLHILIFDKFTEPLYHYLNALLGLQRQQFLFVPAEPLNLTPSENLFLFKSPLSKNLNSNIKTFYKLCSNADRIILHGDPLLHFFALFPSFLKKTSWVIYGQELYSLNKDHGLQNEVKKFVLRKVKNHITHIEGDSLLANQMLHSNASFIN